MGCVLLAVAAVGVSGLLVAVVGFVFLLRRVHLLGVVFLCSGGLVALGAAAYIVGWLPGLRPQGSPESRAAFAAEFQIQPPFDVRDIRVHSVQSTDSEVHYLAFRAQPATILAITQKPFILSDRSRCGETSRDVPPWWTPPTPVADCYVAEPFDKAFHTNRAWLTYDVNTGETRYVYHGID